MSEKDGQSYADILKEMKAKVNPRKTGLEVLSIRRSRKEEVLLVLKKGGDVSAFRKELDLAVGERAQISALVSMRSFEIRDLDETVEKEEVVDALCLALGRPALNGFCRPFTRFSGVKTAVIRLAEAANHVGCVPHSRARGSRPLLQVPWVRPRVAGLQ